MKLSEQISQFLKLYDTCRATYNFNRDIVGQCDKKSVDYLHALELEQTTYAKRAARATIERNNRLERRKAKDIVETYEPFVRFVEAPETTRMVNMLKQALGDIRKVEHYHENRVYRKRASQPAANTDGCN